MNKRMAVLALTALAITSAFAADVKKDENKDQNKAEAQPAAASAAAAMAVMLAARKSTLWTQCRSLPSGADHHAPGCSTKPQNAATTSAMRLRLGGLAAVDESPQFQGVAECNFTPAARAVAGPWHAGSTFSAVDMVKSGQAAAPLARAPPSSGLPEVRT